MTQSGFLRRMPAFAATALLSVLVAFAQGTGSTGGNTGGTGGSTGASTGRGTTRPPTVSDRTQPERMEFPEMRRPMFLQGKVMMSDGSPAPSNIVIERVCHGTVIPEDYTDSKGRFSFEVGSQTNMIPDASTSTGRMTNRGSPFGSSTNPMTMGTATNPYEGINASDLSGCELRASLPGHTSTIVQLAGRRAFDNPDVGTIILTRLGNVQGLTISATTLQAPKKARKAYEKGIKEARKQKWEKAEKELVKAVTEYEEYAEAWYALGQVVEAQERFDEAREAYEKALAADKKFVSPYMKLARMEVRAGNWAQVAATTDTIVKLNPYDFPDAYFYNSYANLELANLPAAEKSARDGIEQNVHTRFPQIEQILGLSLARQNNYQEATVHLKKYLELMPNADNASVVQKQVEQLEAFLAQQAQNTAPQE